MSEQTGERVLHPIGRFEWERIVRLIRWSGVIKPSPKRGAVSPQAVRAVAYVLAQHADEDGSRVRPGDALVAVLAEVDVKQVKEVRAFLLRIGLLQLTRGGRHAGGGDEHQLTYPSDLREQVTVLGPDEVSAMAQEIREKARRKRPDEPRTGSDGPRTEGSSDLSVQGPMDPVRAQPTQGRTGSIGPADEGRTGSIGPAVQGPSDRYTNQDHPLRATNEITDLHTAVTASRARGRPEEDRHLAEVDGYQAPPAGAGSGRCEHGVPPYINCPACRLEPLPASEDDRGHIAQILPFRHRARSA